MKKNEAGMTLVEVLAALVLITLVTSIIWTTVSIATKFNVSETSTLRLQQEANYIISTLQQVHRNCETYNLTISDKEVSVTECVKVDPTVGTEFNGVISNKFEYKALKDNEEQTPLTKDLKLEDFTVKDPSNDKLNIVITTTIARYRIDS